MLVTATVIACLGALVTLIGLAARLVAERRRQHSELAALEATLRTATAEAEAAAEAERLAHEQRVEQERRANAHNATVWAAMRAELDDVVANWPTPPNGKRDEDNRG